MNVNTSCLIFLIFMFVWNVPLGSAIYCYQCEEPTGRACDLNVRKVLTQNCTDSFVCTKYIWNDNGTSTIYRRCTESTICETEGAKGASRANLTLSYCGTCNTTLCNSADSSSYIFHFNFIALLSLVQILFLQYC